MTPKSIVSVKGQVTIPAKVRRALGLSPGDRIAYKVAKGRAEIIPVKGTILDAAGSVKAKGRTEDLTKVRRAVKGAIGRKAVAKGR